MPLAAGVHTLGGHYPADHTTLTAARVFCLPGAALWCQPPMQALVLVLSDLSVTLLSSLHHKCNLPLVGDSHRPINKL